MAAPKDHVFGGLILYPGLGAVLLEPVEPADHHPVFGLDDARVANDQRNEGDRLGRDFRYQCPGNSPGPADSPRLSGVIIPR